MANKKVDVKTTAKKEKEMAPISFRCPVDLKQSIEDLARLSRRDVSAILIELCGAVVDANEDRITKFRQSAGQEIKMPTFATPTKKKSAAKNETSTIAASQSTMAEAIAGHERPMERSTKPQAITIEVTPKDAAENKGGVENENS